MTYEKLQHGDPHYEHVRYLHGLGHYETCDAVDHNEDVVRRPDGLLEATGAPHRGCSNQACFKHRPENTST